MLGYHALKESSTYEEVLTQCVKDNKVKAMQIFVAGPRSYKLINIDHANLKKTI